MQIKNFEDLEIWQLARRLTQEIYTLGRMPKFTKDYALKDQMQRAAVSIMSNVAEASNAAETRSLPNTSMSPKLLAEKFAHNFMWRSIKNTSIKKRQTICSPSCNVCRL